MGRVAAKAGWWRDGRSCRLAFAAILAGSLPAGAAPLTSPGCLDGGEPAVVQAVEPDLGLRLADGRLVRLAGIDGAEGQADGGAAADRLLPWLTGQPVRVAPLGAAADRWGRTPALVFAANGNDGRSVSVGEALLDAGLARARPSAAIAPCWATYLGLEEGARAARRGLWSREGVLSPDDAATLAAHLGRFVIVEGRVESLFAGRVRTYLRFPGGFAISFDRRTGLSLAKAGLAPDTWTRRRLRVRGLLDDRWGMQIELENPEQVEVLGP